MFNTRGATKTQENTTHGAWEPRGESLRGAGDSNGPWQLLTMSKDSKGHACISGAPKRRRGFVFLFQMAPKRKRLVVGEEETEGSKARLNNPWQSKNPLLEN